ncbi:MAG: hypothetical protein ACJA01_002514 [Saprospiraceae bacterium]|jgi:hypothetical protein
MKGPFPIVCRAHSGGRLLAEIYEMNGIQMGVTHPKTKDTSSFGVRSNFVIEHVIAYSQEYLDPLYKGKNHLRHMMSQCIHKYIDEEIEDLSKPFGWKFGETLFTLPVVFDTFSNTKAVHLVRDGRDVMLSRSEERFNHTLFHQAFNRVLVTGHKERSKYRGQLINKDVINQYRTELEFLHWKTVVEYGINLRKYNTQYLEIRYENLCQSPQETLKEIFNFIKVKLYPQTIEWAKLNSSLDRIGKWKELEEETLNRYISGTGSVLNELNYT